MKRRNRKPAPPRRRAAKPAEPGLPGLEVLEEISASSLAKWRAAGRNLEQLSEALFFGLEARRNHHSAELLDAIRRSAEGPREFTGWSRLVDYQYSTRPLSMAGSLKGDGGRFNIGGGLNPAAHTPFPALYIAEDFPTAFRERFGIDPSESVNGLTANELVLRQKQSFTHLARIQMPSGVGTLARKLGLRAPGLVRTPSSLQRMLLHPNWRIDPAQHGLPSSSQIFGRLCAAAGMHGILYPSVRNGGRRCLALFPQNWRGSGSFVRLLGPTPPEIQVRQLDGETEGSLHA